MQCNTLADTHMYRGKNRYERRLQTTDPEKKAATAIWVSACACDSWLMADCHWNGLFYDDFCACKNFLKRKKGLG